MVVLRFIIISEGTTILLNGGNDFQGLHNTCWFTNVCCIAMGSLLYVVCRICTCTLPKTSIAPARRPSQKETHDPTLPTPLFQVTRQFQGGGYRHMYIYIYTYITCTFYTNHPPCSRCLFKRLTKCFVKNEHPDKKIIIPCRVHGGYSKSQSNTMPAKRQRQRRDSTRKLCFDL